FSPLSSLFPPPAPSSRRARSGGAGASHLFLRTPAATEIKIPAANRSPPSARSRFLSDSNPFIAFLLLSGSTALVPPAEVAHQRATAEGSIPGAASRGLRRFFPKTSPAAGRGVTAKEKRFLKWSLF